MIYLTMHSRVRDAYRIFFKDIWSIVRGKKNNKIVMDVEMSSSSDYWLNILHTLIIRIGFFLFSEKVSQNVLFYWNTPKQWNSDKIIILTPSSPYSRITAPMIIFINYAFFHKKTWKRKNVKKPSWAMPSTIDKNHDMSRTKLLAYWQE